MKKEKTKITVRSQEDADVLKKCYGDDIEIEVDTEEKCGVGGLTHWSGIRKDSNFANIQGGYILSKKDSDIMLELSKKIVESMSNKDSLLWNKNNKIVCEFKKL